MRVIKVGGSLLDWPEVVPNLRRWQAAQPAMPTLVVVGGGSLADVFRAAHRQLGLTERDAHWLCVRAMFLNAQMLAALWTELAVVGEPTEAARGAGLLATFDFERWLRANASEEALPETWDVTSDSIAAFVAHRLLASELVLLKSTLPVRGASRAAAAGDGFVDRYFARAARELAVVRCVNLRDPAWPDMKLD